MIASLNTNKIFKNYEKTMINLPWLPVYKYKHIYYILI
jgi:hypothetical protein